MADELSVEYDENFHDKSKNRERGAISMNHQTDRPEAHRKIKQDFRNIDNFPKSLSTNKKLVRNVDFDK